MPFHETVLRSGIDDAFGCLFFAFVIGFVLFRLVTTKTDRGLVFGTDTKPQLGSMTIGVVRSTGLLARRIEITISELDIPGPRCFALDMWDRSLSKRRGSTLKFRQEQMGELADGLEQALGALKNPESSR